MHQVVGIGEILWDVFPDGPRFGGAPANFSCSTSELSRGAAGVLMVSAVGEDELGRKAIESLKRRGVDTSVLQVNQHATGKVDVQLDDDGKASYHFADDAAWDHLVWNDALGKVAATCDAVCFGTLGQRSETSRRTINQFVQATPESALRILDVNLREPFYDDSVIQQSLALANVLKLNDDELPRLARINGLSGDDVDVMRQLAARHQLRYVALTRGADGAAIVSDSEVSDLPGVPTEIADTVGAGDAFTAAITLGLLAGQDIDIVNRNAIAVASYVCSQPGATMTFPDDLMKP
ncbi:carbohydrate kinase [Stieleria sp. ICT_E10.1]|uniref:carbohydrate kinase family protein n=1 Tax=Stieleria sedimenti TaxID=2976331 RepID=UPI00217F3782|nr:carbohydrate kinase [Stieleria sedimenti]MCS7468484.1 carbohydrate kinase [Stieleria sedimenti]